MLRRRQDSAANAYRRGKGHSLTRSLDALRRCRALLSAQTDRRLTQRNFVLRIAAERRRSRRRRSAVVPLLAKILLHISNLAD